MKKRVISIVISFAIIVAILPRTFAVEASNNIVIINDDIYNLTYTYEENGINYLVEEHVNDDFTEVHSKISSWSDSESKYISISEIHTNITIDFSKKSVTITTNQDGELLINHIDVASTSYSKSELQISPLTSGSPGGTWKYMDTTTGNNKIEHYTISAITAGIIGCVSAVIGYKIGGATGAGIGSAIGNALNQLAQEIIDEKIPILYFSSDCYFYYPPNCVYPWDERFVVSYYFDKEMTDYRCSTTFEHEINYT